MKKLTLLLTLTLGMLLGSIQAQTGWNYVNSTGTTFILYGMSFPPGQNNIGYACGMQYTYNADGVIVKTTDGGDNWTQVLPTSGDIDGLQGIWFINDTVGFAGGWNNYFIKTTDGGATWTPVTCGTSVWYYVDVEFWDSNNGVAACYPSNPGSDPAIFVTSDGGNTWTPATGVTSGGIMGLCYADQNTLYAVSTGGEVYISTDGGSNWSVHTNLGAMLFGVNFANTSFGVVGAEEKMFATNDGGATWTSHTTGYENFYACKAWPNGKANIGGTDENIYVTNDFGATWSMEHNGSGTSHLYRIRETQNGTLFACGSQGTIIKKAPELYADFTADADTVCVGGTVNFTDNSTGAIISWEWTFEGGTPGTSSSQNPSVTYNTLGVFDVQLVISNGSFYDTLLYQDYITVIETPGQASTPTGPADGCAGANFSYTTNSVQYATEYQWEVNPSNAGTMSGSDTSATFQSSSSYTGSYAIKVRAGNLCGYGAWSGEFQGTLLALPQPFQLEGEGAYCEGSQGSELTLDGSETGFDYELYLDDVATGNIVAGTGSPISFGYVTDEGIYTAVGFTGNCVNDMYGQVWVHMIGLPSQAGTPEGPEQVCNDTTTVYTTTGSTDADTLIWTLDPVDAGTLTPNNMEATIEWSSGFSGTALLSVTGENNCGTGDHSDNLEIEVNVAPQPLIAGDTFTCQYYQGIVYTTTNNPDNTYSWEISGGTIASGAGTHEVSVDWGAPGQGWLRVTEESPEGCISTTEDYLVTIDECVGIEEFTSENIRIYPNPANDHVNIEVPAAYNAELMIRIMDLTGRTVAQYRETPANGRMIMNISNLNNGIYSIELSNDGFGRITKRLIKN